MQVHNVSDLDGQMAAALAQNMAVAEKLFDALKLAGLPVSGPGMDKRTESAKWLGGILNQMAKDLQTSRAAAATPVVEKASSVMKIKGMGPIGGSSSPSKKKAKSTRK